MTTSPAPIETAPAPRETLPPVALDATAEPVAGIRVELASIESVSGEANLAGEVGGPALRVTLEARNDSVSAFATPGVVVNLYFGDDGAPAGGIREPGGREFPSSVGSGETASGVFLFTVPEDARESILIEVDLQVGEPVVLFEGSVD